MYLSKGGERPPCTVWGGWIAERRTVPRHAAGGELGAGGGGSRGAETQHALALQGR